MLLKEIPLSSGSPETMLEAEPKDTAKAAGTEPAYTAAVIFREPLAGNATYGTR